MQTPDRLRIFRSLGLAGAALLLVGGAVFGSNALTGHRSDDGQPAASTGLNLENGQGASESPDVSESPEASAAESAGEDLNDAESPEASAAESELEHQSEAANPSASPDDNGGDSGHDGGDDSNAK